MHFVQEPFQNSVFELKNKYKDFCVSVFLTPKQRFNTAEKGKRFLIVCCMTSFGTGHVCELY